MSARSFLGAGDLYIARFNPATQQFDAFTGPYEARKFEIKANSELKEQTSKSRGGYGQVLESVAIPQPFDFSVELSEVNKETMSLALLGTPSAINQGSGTMTNVAITAKIGGWVEVGHLNIASAGLTVTDDSNTTTYVLGTDYEVNYRLGTIRALAGGAIVADEVLHVSGTYNAVSGTKISGATQTQVRAMFKLDGVNFADQAPVIVDVFEGVIAVDGAFDFLADDFGVVELSGRLKTPVGKSAPFEVQLLDAAI